jgi:hypothetical protein
MPSPQVDRIYGAEYKIDLEEPIDPIQQYKSGVRNLYESENVTEFPYRSVIRGDFESKHYGTVSWDALQKFKTYLLTNVLSYNGRKLPRSLWQQSLSNYIENNVDVLMQEKTRWGYQNSWFGSATRHGLFSESDGNFSYSWRRDLDSGSFVVNLGQRIRPRKTETVNGITYQYVDRFSSNFGSIYQFRRLGENKEFSLYFPEYESFDGGFNETVVRGIPPQTLYFRTGFNPNLNDSGMLDDLIQHLRQLNDLKYDYSNLDETLTKDWLYLKESSPNIEPLGTNETVSSYPYYNEVYIDNKLADVYLLFVLDRNPPPPPIGDYSNPDFLVRDKWKTRPAGVGVFVDQFEEVDKKSRDDLIANGNVFGIGTKTRPFTDEYQFKDRLLIHTDPPVHSERDPRIISGVEYEFDTKGGQPNHEVITKFKFTPMRLRLECIRPVREERVFKMDSTAYETESKIDATRDQVLPVVLDKRITIYDSNFAAESTNQPVIDYNVNIVKEYPA